MKRVRRRRQRRRQSSCEREATQHPHAHPMRERQRIRQHQLLEHLRHRLGVLSEYLSHYPNQNHLSSSWYMFGNSNSLMDFRGVVGFLFWRGGLNREEKMYLTLVHLQFGKNWRSPFLMRLGEFCAFVVPLIPFKLFWANSMPL